MAVAAETGFVINHQFGSDVLIDPNTEAFKLWENQFQASSGEAYCVNADALHVLNVARVEADLGSQTLLDERMDLLREGRTETVPYEADPLSTAVRVLEAQRNFGARSQEALSCFDALATDCSRYLAEGFRFNTWEYFEPLKQEYSHQAQGYVSHGQAIMPMLDRGITPLADEAVAPLRFMERREEATATVLGRILMKAAGVEINNGESLSIGSLPSEIRYANVVSEQTISQCPDEFIAQYRQDVADGKPLGQRWYNGYTPEIEKQMLRDIRFDPANQCRYEEQLGISGLYIDPEVVSIYLQRKSVIEPGVSITKPEVLGTQIITTDGEGVIGMAKELDAIASEVHGVNIFMGELVDGDHKKDYAAIVTEAVRRQESQQELSVELAEFLLDLADTDIDHWAAVGIVDDYVKKAVFKTVKHDPEAVRQAFNGETAERLVEAVLSYQNGDFQMAEALEQLALAEAPAVGACSGGRCGIFDVDANSAAGKRARAKGLEAGDDGKYLVDTVRKCKNKDCKSTAVVYSVRKNKVSKVCVECGAIEKN